MKKICAVLLLCTLLVSLAACGKENKPDINKFNDNIGHNPDTKTPTGNPDTQTEAPKYDLYISEVMANNTHLYVGSDADWIEIGSREKNTVSLNGYYLTDSTEDPYAFPLEGNVISAEGYAIVLLSESAPFHLSSNGETVYLMRNKEVVDSLTYTQDIGDRSASADGILPYATPGFPNTDEGYQAYLSNVKLSDIILSEAMSSNSKYAAGDGQFYDFVELLNHSDHAVNLSDYYLTDKKSEVTKFQLPAITLNQGEYYVVYCSGLTDREGHAPFKISSKGESLFLTDGTSLVDMLEVPGDLEENKSFGRVDNIFVYMENATPGKQNENGNASRVAIPKPNVAPGQYASEISVELSGEGTIYYTLDGSRPTVNSKVYSGPIQLNGITTVRTFAKDGNRTSEMASYTYLVGIEHTLPVVYVSIPNSYLTGTNGIIDNVSKTIEKECVLSLYEDGEMKFSEPCGFRLHGNDSRKGAKQNFQLRFRSEYGPGKLHYQVFDDLEIDTFDSLLLKGGSEDFNRAMVRDEFCTGLVNGKTNLYVLACKPCILYLGDRYWGIYYLRERFSDDYVAEHFDVPAKSVDLLYSYGGVQSGTSKEYYSLISYCKNHDLSVAENYQYVTDRVDIVSLMDWYICRSYFGDTDYANIRYFRTPEYDGKWRWMFFDLDWSFEPATQNNNYFNSILKFDRNHDFIIFDRLMKNADFKDAFLKRYAELMRSFLNEKTITKALDDFIAVIEPEMEADRKRWNCSVSGWKNATQVLYNYVKDGKRTKHMLNELKSDFGISDEKMKEYFGDLLE